MDDKPVIQPDAAGVDIGAREIFAAVPHDPEGRPVRRFEVFTADLENMARWMTACGVTTVAMESTGVYWIPLYEVLEKYGLKPCVVNPRHMRNVPGRRTDWHECQWIQYLHSMGLLRAAFRPADEICAVRAIVRHRQRIIETGTQHVQHMHKALTQMNLQIHHVISDITGVTGTTIVRAILAGQRDPRRLAELKDVRVKASDEVIVKSLEGNWRAEHLFCLRQSFELYEACLRQIDLATCEIERMTKALDDVVDPGQRALPPDARRRSRPKRKPLSARTEPFDMRSVVYSKYGVDVTQIPGIDQNAVLLLSEVGRDMTRWKDGAHFVGWLALCPDNDITGGKVAWRGSRKQKMRAGQIFRMAAQSQYHSSSEMGHYYRRMRGRLGPQAATMATARKIATIFYILVSRQIEYDPKMAFPEEPDRHQRQLANLAKKARKLGVTIVMPEPASPDSAHQAN